MPDLVSNQSILLQPRWCRLALLSAQYLCMRMTCGVQMISSELVFYADNAHGGDSKCFVCLLTFRLRKSPATSMDARTSSAHFTAVSSALFHPGGEILITTSHDRSVCMWDVSSAVLLQRFTTAANMPARASVFAKDGAS